MASIREVAQEAGVGVGTVSRALNGSGYVSPETKKKIEKAAKKLHYTPNELARNLYHNRTGIVGVVVPDLDHPFFSALVKHIEMELYEQGYKTMICNTVGISRREQEYLDMLERNMVDGIITASHGLEVEEYQKQTKPIVSIDRDLGPRIPLIGCDHEKGGELAARLMLGARRKKVLVISGISPKVMANDRYTAFMKILKENGVAVQQEVMEWNIFNWEAYYKFAEETFRSYPDIDGIFSGDLAALACLNVAQRRGVRVPEELSIIGFDAMAPSSMVYPQLTAVRQNVELLAEVSVNTLLDLVEQRKNVPHRLILDVEMQPGGTA